MPVYNYSVPKAALPVVGEAKAACVEVLDELVSKLFDIHVLEPIVSVQEQYRVKPTIRRPAQEKNRSGRADVLGIIQRAEQKRASIEASSQDIGSRNTNRSNLPKIGSQKR